MRVLLLNLSMKTFGILKIMIHLNRPKNLATSIYGALKKSLLNQQQKYQELNSLVGVETRNAFLASRRPLNLNVIELSWQLNSVE